MLPRFLLAASVLLLVSEVHATVPGSLEITCDVDRTAFRNAARLLQPSDTVTFRIWTDATPGAPDAQVGVDYVVPSTSLAVFKRFTDRYDRVTPRKSARIDAVIGTDANPVVVPLDGTAYLDLTVGSTTLGCDHAATNSASQRRRLGSVAFAGISGHAATCEVCDAVVPAPRTHVDVFMAPDANQGPLPFNTGTRIAFTEERRDDLGEWDPVAKEFTASQAGTYLVQVSALFEDIVDGSTYWARIASDNEGIFQSTKAAFHVMASATGSQPAASVSSTGSTVLQLDAGDKIWASADHNDDTTPASLYWRDYDTFLKITRID